MTKKSSLSLSITRHLRMTGSFFLSPMGDDVTNSLSHFLSGGEKLGEKADEQLERETINSTRNQMTSKRTKRREKKGKGCREENWEAPLSWTERETRLKKHTRHAMTNKSWG